MTRVSLVYHSCIAPDLSCRVSTVKGNTAPTQGASVWSERVGLIPCAAAARSRSALVFLAAFVLPTITGVGLFLGDFY